MAADGDGRGRLQQDLAQTGVASQRQEQSGTREQGDRAIALSAAEDAVQQAIDAVPAQGDIPGVGRFDSLRGEGLFQSEEGRRVRTLASNAIRRYLRLESGAAISDQEMASEMELRGMGPGATEQQFRDGLRDLQRDLQRRAATLRGGLSAPLERGAEPAPSRPQGRGPGSNRGATPAPPARQQANPRPGMVRVELPGRGAGWIPEANLQRALAQGARRL